MTINELEASSVISLIDAFTKFKKGGSLIHFLEACKKVELIDENNKFNEADFRNLRHHRKKLHTLVQKANELYKNQN